MLKIKLAKDRNAYWDPRTKTHLVNSRSIRKFEDREVEKLDMTGIETAINTGVVKVLDGELNSNDDDKDDEKIQSEVDVQNVDEDSEAELNDEDKEDSTEDMVNEEEVEEDVVEEDKIEDPADYSVGDFEEEVLAETEEGEVVEEYIKLEQENKDRTTLLDALWDKLEELQE